MREKERERKKRKIITKEQKISEKEVNKKEVQRGWKRGMEREKRRWKKEK